MSIKIALMAFQKLDHMGVRDKVDHQRLFEADPTGRLKFLPLDLLNQVVPAAALKSSWSLDRRTGKYRKF